MDVPDTSEDVDLTLRQVSRRFPKQFATALLPPGTRVSAAAWLDTQVAERQRRLDRVLEVMADGLQRFEHTEWQLRMRREPFSGVTYRIDAVYQRTVEELVARGSTLWLIFTPLAVDADAAAMARVLGLLRAAASDRELDELVAALLVMADTDGRRRGLRQVIVPLLKEETVMRSWVYEQGNEKGIETGRERGIKEGLQPARNAVVRDYQRRFGPMPPALLDRLQAAHQPELLDRWCQLVEEGPKADVDSALAAD